MGIPRQGLEDIDGFFAVLLWHDYQRGNPRALDTLLAYNALDVINLEALMVNAYNAKLAGTSLGREYHLPVPTQPPLSFNADEPTIRRLKSQHDWHPF